MPRYIEAYFHIGTGYNPFLIREGWQVAQLNYMQQLRAPEIRRLERHIATDEVFVLFKGKSVLIAAEQTPDELHLETELMTPGVTYNVPARTWQSIAMTPGDTVIIVEKSNTHLNDDQYRDLNEREYVQLQAAIKRAEAASGCEDPLPPPSDGVC